MGVGVGVRASARACRQPVHFALPPAGLRLGGNDWDTFFTNQLGSYHPTPFSMGFASCVEPRFRSAIPDTPPEALTPDSASFPSRQSEERPWNPRAPPSPPMSNYDPVVKPSDMSSTPGKGSAETAAREDSSAPDHSAPRQQLPPLSSLFGPKSQLPFPSAFSDRPGPPYTCASPLDHPLRPAVGSSSYFPPSTCSASQPRSMSDARFQDRPQIAPLSRIFPGPLSPQLRPPDQREGGRSEHGSAGSQWPVQHETNREYSIGSRDRQSYNPVADRYPPPLSAPGREEGRRPDFRGEQLMTTTTMLAVHHSPGTPTSSSIAESSDGAPTKDGLGPKIWTGTHFLPRFVRAAEVPGEGMCYFYDDGSHCKTVIDGEAVNAHWGVTKAGKPRKRLAIACVTCREKKIKCDPDYPRCVQCEKFGRVCKFKNAPRGGHNTSPSTPSAELEDARRLGATAAVRQPVIDTRGPPSRRSSESVSPRTTGVRPASPDPAASAPRKQARMGYEHYSPTAAAAGGTRSPRMAPTVSDPTTAARSVFSWRQHPPPESSLPRIHEDVLCRASSSWQTDPRPDARV